MTVECESAFSVGTAVSVDGTCWVLITLGNSQAVITAAAAHMYAGHLSALADYAEQSNETKGGLK